MTVHTLSALQTLASLALTAMSVVVASAALSVSFRQNVGWRPIILVTSVTWRGGFGPGANYVFESHLEFWNRRRYPVVLQTTSGLLHGMSSAKTFGQRLDRFDEAIQPSSRHKMKLTFEFPKESMDAARPIFDIEVWFFDPRKNSRQRLRIKHKAFYPDLGWKKPKRERVEAKLNFEATARTPQNSSAAS